MGARVAMFFALAYPAATDGLISMDMAPRQYERGHDDIFAALESVDLNTTSRKDIEAALAQSIREAGTLQFLMKNLSRREGGDGFEWKINLPVIKANYDNIIEPFRADVTYEGPTLFVRGGESRYITDEDLGGIRNLFPYAELVTVDGAGHWIHADRPAETYELIARFMESL